MAIEKTQPSGSRGADSPHYSIYYRLIIVILISFETYHFYGVFDVLLRPIIFMASEVIVFFFSRYLTVGVFNLKMDSLPSKPLHYCY